MSDPATPSTLRPSPAILAIAAGIAAAGGALVLGAAAAGGTPLPGALVPPVVLWPAVIGLALAWLMGTLEIDSEGIRLYRLIHFKWQEIEDVARMRLFGLRYLRLHSRRHRRWEWLPIYLWNEEKLQAALERTLPASRPLLIALKS